MHIAFIRENLTSLPDYPLSLPDPSTVTVSIPESVKQGISCASQTLAAPFLCAG